MQIKYYQCSENTLNGTPLEPGSIYRTTDTKRFYVDPIDGGERILIGGAASGGGETVNESDIIIVSTEEYREGLEEPVPGKLYFVSESGKLYIYYDGKWNKIGSDAAGEIVNPDWNQNDETASDFIKNRPFYTGDLVERELYDVGALMETGTTFWMQGVEVSDTDFMWLAIINPANTALEAGKTYSVIIDGVEHIDTARAFDLGGQSGIGFGDLEAAMAQDNANMEYVVLFDTNNNQIVVMNVGPNAPSNDCKIFEKNQEIVKIDPKYLHAPDWDENDSSSASFIKNRPFYTGDLVEELVFDMCALAEANGATSWEEGIPVDDTNYLWAIGGPTETGLVAGTNYTACIDGVDYTGIAKEVSINGQNIIGFGDLDAYMNQDLANFKFMAISLDQNGTIITQVGIVAPESPSMDCKILIKNQEIVKIDPKYLHTPDWDENDPNSASFIKNRPFYNNKTTKNIVVEWDGSTEGRTPVADDIPLYKISDAVITGDDINRDTTIFTIYDDGNTESVTGSTIYPILESNGAVTDDFIMLMNIGAIVINPCTIEGLEFTESGIYLMNDNDVYFSKIEAICTVGDIKKIDPMYLPEGGVGYTENTVYTLDLKNYDLEFDYIDAYKFATIGTSDVPLVEGNEYSINLYGNKYTATCYIDSEGYLSLGNNSIVDEYQENTGESFFISTYEENGIYIYDLFVSSNYGSLYSVEVFGSETTEVVHKIDAKYLDVKTDWNENNESSASYIKNRTHWTEIVVEDTIIEEVKVNCLASVTDLLYAQMTPVYVKDPTKIIPDKELTVIWDGTAYKCYVNEEDNSIGNTITDTDPDGLPFVIALESEDNVLIASLESGEHTISMHGSTEEVVHKIDPKYLPDNIGVQPDWNQTDETAPDFIKNKPEVNKFDSIIFIDAKTGYEYIAQVYDGNFITFRMPDDISITTMPTKTGYEVGDVFDPTGMVITATYADGTTSEITNYTYPETVTEDFKIYCIGYNKYLDLDLTISEFSLEDFEYTDNGDGTYTLTGWKGTYNGEPSTEIVIPDNENIIL